MLVEYLVPSVQLFLRKVKHKIWCFLQQRSIFYCRDGENHLLRSVEGKVFRYQPILCIATLDSRYRTCCFPLSNVFLNKFKILLVFLLADLCSSTIWLNIRLAVSNFLHILTALKRNVLQKKC